MMRYRLRGGMPRPAGEDGWTLMEVVVSMVIMSIFLAMITTGVVEVFRSVVGSSSIADAQAQVNLAFLKLDRDVRYASNVSAEGQVGTAWYVEYLTSYSGTAICSQLRLDTSTQVLSRRSWTQGGSPANSWTILATTVTSTRPFTFIAAGSTYTYPRLRLSITATAGGGQTMATKQFTVTFTAVNARSNSTTVCTEGRPS